MHPTATSRAQHSILPPSWDQMHGDRRHHTQRKFNFLPALSFCSSWQNIHTKLSKGNCNST